MFFYRRIFLAAIVLLALPVILTMSSCADKKQVKKTAPSGAADIASIIPGETALLVKSSSIATIYKNFSVTGSSVFGQPLGDISELKNKIGFNPFILAELQANGFDTQKEAGFFMANIGIGEMGSEPEPVFDLVLFASVADGQKALERVLKVFRGTDESFQVSEEEGLTVIKREGSDIILYITLKDGYIFAGMNPAGDAKPFMKKLLGPASEGDPSVKPAPVLAETQIYKEVASKINSKKNIFAFMNMKEFTDKNFDIIKNLMSRAALGGGMELQSETPSIAVLKDYRGIGLALDLDSKDFELDVVYTMKKNSKGLDLVKGAEYDKTKILAIKDNPAVLFSFAANAQEYFKYMLSTSPKFRAGMIRQNLEMIKEQFGIDLEKDLLGNLAGNLNAGIFDGTTINMLNYNALLTVNLKDEAKMKELIGKVLQTFPPGQIWQGEIANVYTYVYVLGVIQIYVGIKDKNLIVSMGKFMYEKAIKGDPSTGFLTAIKDKKLAEALKGKTDVLYVKVDEVLKALNNFPPVSRSLTEQHKAAIRKFDYLLISRWLEGTTGYGKLLIKTNFSSSFLIGIKNMIQKFQVAAPPKKDSGGAGDLLRVE
ncbi:MAG: hypothetical protein GY754_32990 [bacterium]|nr:hypothetical protein [bacterium]